jgi:hypothetical protein
MSEHDAKFAHRAPSVLANETLAASLRVAYTAQHAHHLGTSKFSCVPNAEISPRTAQGISPRRTNVPLVRPQVNWTEALGEVLG